MSDRAATIQGLRELASFLEEHPDVPAPKYPQMNVFLDDRAAVAVVARLGGWNKEYYDNWFALAKDFSGDVSLHLNVEREQVCRRVVTGTRVVPAEPEREVEIVEWVCEEPLLEVPRLA